MVIMVKNETTVPRAENRPNVFGLQGARARACYNPTRRAPIPRVLQEVLLELPFCRATCIYGVFFIYVLFF